MHMVSFLVMHIHHHNGEVSLVKGFMVAACTDIKTTGFHCDSFSSFYQHYYIVSVTLISISVVIVFIIIIAIAIVIIINIIVNCSAIIMFILIIVFVNYSMANSNEYLGHIIIQSRPLFPNKSIGDIHARNYDNRDATT